MNDEVAYITKAAEEPVFSDNYTLFGLHKVFCLGIKWKWSTRLWYLVVQTDTQKTKYEKKMMKLDQQSKAVKWAP